MDVRIANQTLPRPLVRLESLEPRTLLSGPSAREQQMLELINRLRMHPAAELSLLLHSSNTDVNDALTVFDVDRTVLAEQWKSLSPVAPLAWNAQLSAAALGHTQLLLQYDTQSHRVTAAGEKALGGRLLDAGYNYTLGGENVYSYAKSIIHAHAGFAIDWGYGPSGIQSPPGHRDNLMDPQYQEVGLAVLDSTPGKTTGPLLVTQDFGQRSLSSPFVLGVVYRDSDGDGFYSPGEGLSDIDIQIAGRGQIYSTSTMTAGGYQLSVPAGTYTVRFSGAGLDGEITRAVTVGASNVKLDLVDAGVSEKSLASHAGASSMAYAASGKLYLGYYDAQKRRLVFVRRSLQGKWTAPFTVDREGDVGRSLSLALDDRSQPGIAYYDATNKDLKYAHFNGRRWMTKRVDRIGNVGLNPSLAYDNAGNPGIAYYDRVGGDQRFAYWAGDRWSIDVVQSAGDAGRFSSVEYFGGQWHIAFVGGDAVRFASGDGKNWNITTAASASSGVRGMSLALSEDGDPGISFYDLAGAALKYAGFDGGWSVQTIASGRGVGTLSALDFEPGGVPNVVYHSNADDSVHRAVRLGGVWSQSVIGGGGPRGLSAAIDDDALLSFAATDERGVLFLRDL